MATLPIPQGAILQPLQSVPIPQGATLQPIQPSPQPQQEVAPTYNPQRSPMDFIASAAGPAYALAGNPDVREFGKQMLQKATDPSLLFGATGLGQLVNQGKQLYSMAKGQTGPPSLAAAAGAVGIDPESVKRNAETQNYPGLAADVAFPVLSMEATKRIGAAPSPSELFQQMRPKGAQSLMYPKAAALPPQVVNATEDIFRAAAPTNTNIKFRDSLYTAAPDLAEIARKVNLDEMKGGIINPDMRVKATVKAIDAHLADMYKTEREPQIEPYKNQTVENKLDFDAKNGLRYLVKNAGQVGDRFLAAKALNGDPMTAGGLNRLAIVTNEELTPLRSMTPQERMAAQLTNKKLSGLQSLDKGLSNNLNDFLQAQGEPGLRGYEQRYAALSDVRNGLRSRINAAELDVPGVVKGVVRPAVGMVTGGAKGIASASQAAVADVNIGRSLQGAMKTLAESDLKPKRAIRNSR